MDLTGLPIPKMDWESSNLPEAWKKFQNHVSLLYEGPLLDKDEDIKVKYLLLWVRDRGREIFSTWTDMQEDDRKKLEPHYTRFKAYVLPRLNPIFARFKFSKGMQGTNSIEQYITKLKSMVKDCAYTNPDEMVRDQIVFGTASQKVREKLINEGAALTIEKAIQIAQTCEYSQEQLKMMNSQSQEVYSVRGRSRPVQPFKQRQSMNIDNNSKHSQSRGRRQRYHDNRKTDRATKEGVHRKNDNTTTIKEECKQCGKPSHKPGNKCPALGQQCSRCLRYNHFAKKCYSNVHVQEVNDLDSMSIVDDASVNDESSDEFFIDCIGTNNGNIVDQTFCNMKIENNPVKLKLDTGSQVNILPKNLYDGMAMCAPLTPSDARLSAYGGQRLTTLGQCEVECSYKDKRSKVTFHILNTNSSPILGMKDCIKFGLIKLVYTCDYVSPTDSIPMTKEQVLSEFPDTFDGIGLFPGTANISIDPNVPPAIHPPRRILLALQSKLEDD